MADDQDDDIVETYIDATPVQDSQFASLGKLLLVVVGLAAVAFATMALFYFI